VRKRSKEDGTAVLLDCGNGVFSKLRRYRDYTIVDAVLISHLHADHFLDLIPFAYALTYAPRQQPVPVDRWPGAERPARPKLFAPEGATDVFRRVVGAWGNRDLIENAFEIEEFGTKSALEVGPLAFRFQGVPHFTQTFAVEIRSLNGGARITYGSDCCPNDELVEFARGTDLLLVEATLPRPERTGVRGHLTPEEAAEHARRASAKRVVLTHVSDELDELWVRRCAERVFGRGVDIAREGTVYEP
jgi:ribonuclease BN (tRNA processing enzyme)